MKGFKSVIINIATDTFNTGQNCVVTQFMQSRKNVANYLQCTVVDEGYLVTKTVRMGKEQKIALPAPVDTSMADTDNQRILQEEAIRAIAKRKAKLDNALKKGFAMVYDQCLLKVRDKLEASNRWDKTQREQLLHDLITKIKRICVRFNGHEQEVFNLVQALKTLFLYMQAKKESINEYTRDFKSLWDMVEAFGGSPGIHKGLVKGILELPGQVSNPNNINQDKQTKTEEEVVDVVKAALLISGADK